MGSVQRQTDEQLSVGRRINNNTVSPVVSHMQTKAHMHTFDWEVYFYSISL